eukprot:TRINITY_DN2328_c0_g1_i1.p1 TRINITY_DN2328_c0_g1~~TRINITY_DN2328_c0_g1_i1.p1  ORF type:complete len:208 (-),score=33.94 TRINITY_DN2328_c0_g1_i1:39-662(-)
MEKAQFFSLWAMPATDSSFYGRLSEVIQELSAEFECPPFEPHMTVLGSVGRPQNLGEEEVKARSQALCRSLKPFKCRVSGVSVGSTYFQSVYLLIDQTDEVMRPNWQARLFFGLEAEDKKTDGWSSIPSLASSAGARHSGYMPHMSLLYGDIGDEARQRVKSKVLFDYNDILSGDELSISSLCLYRTDVEDKKMKTWEKIAEYPLEG